MTAAERALLDGNARATACVADMLAQVVEAVFGEAPAQPIHGFTAMLWQLRQAAWEADLDPSPVVRPKDACSGVGNCRMLFVIEDGGVVGAACATPGCGRRAACAPDIGVAP